MPYTIFTSAPPTGALRFLLYVTLVIIGGLITSTLIYVKEKTEKLDEAVTITEAKTERVIQRFEQQIATVKDITQGHPIGRQSAQAIPIIKIRLPLEFRGCETGVGCMFRRGDMSIELPAMGEDLLENCELIIDELSLIHVSPPYKGTRVWAGNIEKIPPEFTIPDTIPEGIYEFRWNPHTNCRGLNSRLVVITTNHINLKYGGKK